MNHSLHHCPNIDDNYGPQVVKKGSCCPFCGIEEKDIVSTESTQPKAEADKDD